MTLDLRREFLWSGSMPMEVPLTDRVRAAANHGYTEVSVWVADYDRLCAEGGRPAELCKWAADLGIGLSVMDGIVDWYPRAPTKWEIQGLGATIDGIMAAAEAFGSTVISSVAVYPARVPVEDLAEPFAVLCDRAAAVGAAVQLEFLPVPPVGDVATAWRIIRDAGRPNGGILFDTWHFFRGNPDFEALSQVPGDRIYGVQINDGSAEVVESPGRDALRHRRHAGDGIFDLSRVVAALDAIGGLHAAGPEVFSVELHALPPDDIARIAAEAFDQLAERLRDF
jgi:sugar phosphate isomerase/epimerase